MEFLEKFWEIIVFYRINLVQVYLWVSFFFCGIFWAVGHYEKLNVFFAAIIGGLFWPIVFPWGLYLEHKKTKARPNAH